MAEHLIYELGDFPLQKGFVLPNAKLGYSTLGTLNTEKNNVIVCPTWITGTPSDVEASFTGVNRAINPDDWFIIIPNHFGAGVSSSPSNTPEPFEKNRFPHVTTYDSVTAQHRLVTELFGIEQIKLVSSWSMGASQAYAWAALFPEMVHNLAAVNGSARTANYNKLFLEANIRAIEADPAFNNGYYDRAPVTGIRSLAAIYAGWAFSEPFYRNEEFQAFGSRTVHEFIQNFWEAFFLKNDANNLLAQLRTWMANDLGDHPNFGGSFEKALQTIRAKTVIIQSDTDRYFPPVDSDYEASHIPDAVVQRMETTWGHMAPFNPADQAVIDRHIAQLLAS